MRAPPPPRKSNSNILLLYLLHVRHIFTGQKIKRRWRLHRLKRNAHRSLYRKRENLSPISGLRVEDMFNLPTDLQPYSSKNKPLLIATFGKGCDRSPKLEYLKKNKFPRRTLTRRKYRLKYLNGNKIKYTCKNMSFNSKCDDSLTCAKTVRSIKYVTGDNADVRLIFHNKNIIKRLNIRNENRETPGVLEFDANNSVNLHGFKTLSTYSQKEKQKPKEIQAMVKYHLKETVEPKSSTKLVLYGFSNSTLISHSENRRNNLKRE